MIFKQPCLFQVADKVPFLQTDRNWIDIFHQLILFIIILGRWMLPKASGVTRDQLSQILLTFIGVGADILEFVTETMKVWTLLTSPDLKPDVYRNLKCVANSSLLFLCWGFGAGAWFNLSWSYRVRPRRERKWQKSLVPRVVRLSW